MPHPPLQRLDAIALARRQMIQNGHVPVESGVAPWVVQSWRRCAGLGLQMQHPVNFNQISTTQLQRTLQEHHTLLSAARPVLEQLGQAIANSRYFAILTNAQGVVVDAAGAIDHSDQRADLITRVGTDLSEGSLGTTAISAALTEQQSVWLHRGEHFFDSNAVYSCAGSPLFGPDGRCIGMLDVTGIEVQERPELKHLVTQSACRIENALLVLQKHRLLLRLNWPGYALGSDADALIGLDADGVITGCNRTARLMVAELAYPLRPNFHIREVFGVAQDSLFDAARHNTVFELPLWSGLRLQAWAIRPEQGASSPLVLRDVKSALIHQAVAQARGNVTEAAKALGVSRATVYRKLGQRPH
jgi:sigma-54 dependent transcriptional regulator, acetoin dehydrogenase operon transcriptional activator AcoR